MADSQTIRGSSGTCNVFCTTKGLIIAEVVLLFLFLANYLFFFGPGPGPGLGPGPMSGLPLWICILLAALIVEPVVEYIGINKRSKYLILFGCIVRVVNILLFALLIVDAASPAFTIVTYNMYNRYGRLFSMKE